MFHTLIVLLVALLPLFASARVSPPVAQTEIKSILNEVDVEQFREGDILVLDLDNTVFREAQSLGTDEWYSHELNKLIKTGLSEREAAAILKPLNRSIKRASLMNLMEGTLHLFIRRLQKRGVNVMALTARHPDLAEITIRQLHELWVDFSLSNFKGSENLSSLRLNGHEFRFHGGIAFTDGAAKGEALKAILLKTAATPGRIVAIDDRAYHVESIVSALKDMGIAGAVHHYTRAPAEPFDAQVAEKQLEIFKVDGLLVPDKAIRLKLQGECQEHLGPPGA